MKVIGLTGGIGSGKSTVAQILAELGATLIDVDRVGHEVFLPGTGAWHEVVDAFGKEVLAPNGTIDRGKLGQIVFRDNDARNRLNKIMHPRMFEAVKAKLAELRRQGMRVVVLEAPLLIEAGWQPLVDEIWVTVASEFIILQRLKNSRGMSQEETLARIDSQLPVAERAKHADIIINTDCSLEEVRQKVKRLWERREKEPAS